MLPQFSRVDIFCVQLVLKRNFKGEDFYKVCKEVAQLPRIYALFIINRNGVPLFTKTYASSKVEPNLISGFLTAVSSFVREISPEQKSALRSIDAEGMKIMLESGENTVCALLVDYEDKLSREALRTLVEKFEEKYGEALRNWNGNVAVFDSFEEDIEKILWVLTLKPYHVPILKKRVEEDVKISRDFWPLFASIDGHKTIEEVAKEVGVSVDEAIARIKDLAKVGLVDVDIVRPLQKIVEIGKDAIYKLLQTIQEILGTKIGKKFLTEIVKPLNELIEVHNGNIEFRDVRKLAWHCAPSEILEVVEYIGIAFTKYFNPLLGKASIKCWRKIEEETVLKNKVEVKRLHAI